VVCSIGACENGAMGAYRTSAETELHPLETLHRLFGAEVANGFHDKFAGTSLYIPAVAASDNPVVKAFGAHVAAALASECGGLHFEIPSNRERRVAELFAAGSTTNEIARELTLTARGVRHALRRLGLNRHCRRPVKKPAATNGAS
jgi:DNA-binding NarL/FixJ family response regulator